MQVGLNTHEKCMTKWRNCGKSAARWTPVQNSNLGTEQKPHTHTHTTRGRVLNRVQRWNILKLKYECDCNSCCYTWQQCFQMTIQHERKMP